MKTKNCTSLAAKILLLQILPILCIVLCLGKESLSADSCGFRAIGDITESLDQYYRSLYPISFSYNSTSQNEGELLSDGKYFWIKSTDLKVGNSVDGNVVTEYSFYEDTPQIYNSLYVMLADGYESAVPTDGGLAVIGELPTSEENVHITGGFSYPEILGWFPLNDGTYVYIPDFLKENVHAEISRETSDTTYRISIKKDVCRYVLTLGFDDNKNCYVKSFSHAYSGNDYSSGRVLEQNFLFEDFARLNNRLFPQKMSSAFEMLLRDTVKSDRNSESVFKNSFVVFFANIEINRNISGSDFQIKTPIPNGTPVTIQSAPQIQYIWFDGKIVPKTNEAMLAVARGNHKFMPGPDEPRFWLMAIGIILILIGGGKMTYDHFFKNKDDEDMP